MANRAGNIRYGDGFPVADLRIGQQGDLIDSQLNPAYYEQAARGNTFFSTSLARATSLPATAMVGNVVWNPPDSGVNCVITKWQSSMHATSATCTGIMLGVGYQTTQPTTVTVADTVGSTFVRLNGATNAVLVAPKAKGFAIATMLFAPVVVWHLHHNTAAIATTGVDSMQGDLQGAIIVPPGGYFCVVAQGAAAAAASHSSSLMWEEVAVL